MPSSTALRRPCSKTATSTTSPTARARSGSRSLRVTVLVADRDDRTRRSSDDVLGHTSEQGTRQTLAPVRANDDEVGVDRLRHRVDLFPDDSLTKQGLDYEPSGRQALDRGIERGLRRVRDVRSDGRGRDDRAVGETNDGKLV